MPIRKHPLAALCLPAVIFSFISLPAFAQSASGEALPEAEAQTIVDTESSSAQPSSDVTPAPPARAVTPRPAPAKASSSVKLPPSDEVVITANRLRESKREVSSNVTVITAEDIKASTATSLDELVVQNGFHVVTMGDTSAVQIRGMAKLTAPTEHESPVLILLNGRRIGNANLALVGLANVERVEIIRGPSAVQYGSSAMGGVINVITKSGKDAKPFALVELGLAGSDSLKRNTVAFGGAANGFDYAFGGMQSSRDDMTTQGGQRWYHTAVKENLAYNLDLGYTFLENHRVGINHNLGEIKSELVGGCPWPANCDGIRPGSANEPGRAYTDYVKRNTNTAFSYTGATGGKALDWMLNYSSGKDDQERITPATGVRAGKTVVDNKVYNAQVNYHASLFTLSGGVDRYQYDISGLSTDPESAMKDTGAYLTGKLRLLRDSLIFSAGLRHDRFENSGDLMNSEKDDHTGGSVGVSYLPLNWLKLRANYANGFKMPTPTQVGGDGAVWTLGNPSLKPEQSKTWEFGTDIDWNNLNASLTYFHSNWKDKIIGLYDAGDFRCSGGWGCTQYQNLKDSEIAGVEGSLGWDVGKAFNQGYSLKPYASFTWLETRKNKDESQFIAYHGAGNKTLPNTPEWMASYGIDYAHSSLKLKSRLNANYYGTTLTQDWSGTVVMPSGDTYFARPSGTVVNWGIEKELVDFSNGQYGKLTLRADINNLFDKANEMYWNYPGQGRNFYVGLRYDFN